MLEADLQWMVVGFGFLGPSAQDQHHEAEVAALVLFQALGVAGGLGVAAAVADALPVAPQARAVFDCGGELDLHPARALNVALPPVQAVEAPALQTSPGLRGAVTKWA